MRDKEKPKSVGVDTQKIRDVSEQLKKELHEEEFQKQKEELKGKKDKPKKIEEEKKKKEVKAKKQKREKRQVKQKAHKLADESLKEREKVKKQAADALPPEKKPQAIKKEELKQEKKDKAQGKKTKTKAEKPRAEPLAERSHKHEKTSYEYLFDTFFTADALELMRSIMSEMQTDVIPEQFLNQLSDMLTHREGFFGTSISRDHVGRILIVNRGNETAALGANIKEASRSVSEKQEVMTDVRQEKTEEGIKKRENERKSKLLGM